MCVCVCVVVGILWLQLFQARRSTGCFRQTSLPADMIGSRLSMW